MTGVYLRAAALAVAIFASYVFASPVLAQSQETVLHGAEIRDLARRANGQDAALQRMEGQEAVTAAAVSELQGEDRVFFWVLSLLTGGSLVTQVVQISKRRQ